MCGGYALTLFRHEELELLVCGLPHLDFEALQRAARYEAGFHAQHPTIHSLWRVIHGFTLEQKKRFLFFTTGCDRCCMPLSCCVHAGGELSHVPCVHSAWPPIKACTARPVHGAREMLHAQGTCGRLAGACADNSEERP